MKNKCLILLLSYFLSACVVSKIEERSALSSEEETKIDEIGKVNNIEPSKITGDQTINLLNHKYVLHKIANNSSNILHTIMAPYIIIDDRGKIYGFAGCNRLFGKVDLQQIQDDILDFTGIGTTRMMCEQSAYDLEQQFLLTLSQVIYYKLENRTLILQNKNLEELLVLQQEDID